MGMRRAVGTFKAVMGAEATELGDPTPLMLMPFVGLHRELAKAIEPWPNGEKNELRSLAPMGGKNLDECISTAPPPILSKRSNRSNEFSDFECVRESLYSGCEDLWGE
mmetsp:Transcript_24888/g.39983  ORF Transcript_24888/g.39983 Transcript_24888/m.39983 type:complete len:108 (-) Transcript_24888:1527-1850(-)